MRGASGLGGAPAAVAALLLGCAVAYAGPYASHFGVNLALDFSNPHDDVYQAKRTYAFLPSSFAPTLHTDTVDYVVNDWHGSWSATQLSQYVTNFGQYPSGEEPYDVEALYFDDDPQNLYFAVVTSVPPPPGVVETRYNNVLVVAGDLAIGLGLNPQHSTDDPFSYDYGVNINQEHRNGGVATSGGTQIGSRIYRTANSDWYVGTATYAVTGKGEYTNIDPGDSTFAGTIAGQAAVSYDKVFFYDGGGNEIKESLWDTYVIEVTVPRRMLAPLNVGDQVGMSFTPGCRNDGEEGIGILRFATPPTVNYQANIPEPGTAGLLCVGLLGLSLLRRRRQRA
jgi:hypothetical protein